MIDDKLDARLRRWGSDVREHTPDTPLPDWRFTGRRRPKRLLAAAGAAAVVIVFAVVVSVVAAQRGGETPSPVTRGGAPTPVGALVVHDGDVVVGQGIVLWLPGRPVRFCAPVPIDGVGGHDYRFDYCKLGVNATGVDLGRLTDRATRARDGAVYGRTRLQGTYRHGTLAVTHQSSPIANDPSLSLPTKLPCPAPAGGWPRGAKYQSLNPGAVTRYQRAHRGSIVEFAELRPSSRQVVVYVLTSGDPTPVDTALRPAFGKRLCVTQSKWTSAQLTQAGRTVKKVLLTTNTHRGLTAPTDGATDGLGPDAQIQIFLDVPIVDQSLADKLDVGPPGLIAVHPWLRPQ